MAQTVYSPPISTYTPLATVEGDGTTSTFNFTNIPNTYRDLVLVFSGAVVSGTPNLEVRLNNDSGTDRYRMVGMEGDGSGKGASSQATTRFNLTQGTNVSTTPTVGILHIFDYAQTDKEKSVLSRFNNPANATNARVGRYNQTTAIDEVNVFTLQLTTGSRISLYGIEA